MSSDDPRSGGSSAGMPAGGDPSASASMAGASQSMPDPMIGQTIGRYRIVAKLGEGGMGEVYAAEHLSIHKRVAIKLLRPEITSNEEAVARFEQEAKSSSKIGHKNIIGIDDFGRMPDGRIFLFMELLDGQPLNDMLEQPMDPTRLLNIVVQTCHGLEAAHTAGVVHRDMKPENIFVTTGDVAKILDFGIAKVAQGEGENHLTRTGTIFGTPFYMAPEQALGTGVDHRADIYAMGVIMYECFCGSVPFQGESFMGILTQHITASPKPPLEMAMEIGGQNRVAMIPAGLPEVIAKCMAKDANHRYQAMGELIAALVEVHRGVAGPGMSAYLEAQPMYPPSGMHQSMPTPIPSPPGAPSQATMAAPASGGYQVGPSGSYPTGADSQVFAQSQSFAQPKKSKAGLWIVLIALLLVGGGVGGYLFWASQQESGTTAQGGDGEGDTTTNSGGDTDNPLAGKDADAGSEAASADAAAVAAGEADAGAVAAATPDAAAKVEVIKVLVDSVPRGAKVYRDGVALKKKTPMNIRVTKGEPVELVVKRRGREDQTVVIDGAEEEVTVKLPRIKKTGGNGGNNGNTTAEPKRGSAAYCKMAKHKEEMICKAGELE